ncbi:MAG: ion channel [Solirubrobacteraceae bacterium]
MPLFLIAASLVHGVKRHRVATLVAFATAMLVLGAVLFSLTQHVSIGLGLYWAVTTATTVGYGDVTPHNTIGRVIAVAVMLGTIPVVGAVFALVAGASALNRMRRLLGMDRILPSSNYTLIYGSHPVLSRVLIELTHSGQRTVLVAPTRPTDLSDDHHFLAGDPSDENVVRSSHPERADRALIACESDADTLVVAVSVRSLAPELEVYALTQSPSVAHALSDLGITHTLATDELIGHTLAKSLEAPQSGDVLLALVDSDAYRIVETEVDADLAAQPLSVARGGAHQLVLGVYHDGRVELGITSDPVLAVGDRLILVRPAT